MQTDLQKEAQWIKQIKNMITIESIVYIVGVIGTILLHVFDVTLEQEDVSMIDCMPPAGWSGEHPDFVIPGDK